jgi:metacaspase-1
MVKAEALLIGLNSVDPNAYDGWNGESGCWSCELDTDNIANLLREVGGYNIHQLKTKEATSEIILSLLDGYAKRMEDGDIFTLFYSGHGGQEPDLNGDESDGKDETLVVYDRQIVDDELSQCWNRFAEGVRIFTLSDSCNSGTVFKSPLPEYLIGTPDNSIEVIDEMVAELIHMSGCRDGYTSDGGMEGSAFTNAFVQVWNNGGNNCTYPVFHKRLLAQMERNGDTQISQYRKSGPVSPKYEDSLIFSI